MPLKGSAFLAIWHDIETHGELEYNAWHTLTRCPAVGDDAKRPRGRYTPRRWSIVNYPWIVDNPGNPDA